MKVTINRKRQMQNGTLELTGLTTPRKPRGLTATGQGLAQQDSAGRVSWRVWNRTDGCLEAKPGSLVGYPDPLLTLQPRHILISNKALLIIGKGTKSTVSDDFKVSLVPDSVLLKLLFKLLDACVCGWEASGMWAPSLTIVIRFLPDIIDRILS